MKNLFNITLSLALAAVVGCATSPEEQKTASANLKTESSNAKSVAAKPAAPSKPKTVQQRLNELCNSQDKRRVTNKVAIDELFKFRDEVAGTNRADRIATEMRIIKQCRMPAWTALKRWDKTLADVYVPQLCKPAVEDATLTLPQRLDYAGHYCLWLAGWERYDEADQVAAKLVDASLKLAKDDTATQNAKASALVLKGNCRRWRFDYDGAMKAYREAMKYNYGRGRDSATRLAFEYDKDEDAQKLWEGSDPYGKISFFTDQHRGNLVRDLAVAYALCPTNPPAKRSEIVNRFFLTEKSPEAAKVRAVVKDVYDSSKGRSWILNNSFNSLYTTGDWAFFAELYEYARLKSLDTPAGHRAHVFALAASGQTAKALAKADDYLKDAKLDKKERAKLGALRAIVADRDALEPLVAIKDDPKAYAEAVRNAATWCLNLEKNGECRRYSEAYAKLVKPQPKRRYGVKWFDQPVTSISDWRRVADSLEKTYTDIKMAGDLDNLVTDVATGRIAVEKTEKDSDDVRFEVTSLCDVNGLSIFLRVEDPNARLVEKGLAGGLGTEMYFAPGDNQPYICFGSNPRAGVNFAFQTTYEYADHKRLNVKGPRDRYSLVSEVGFSDADYVLRLFFPWDAFYQKLPAKGGEWKYECLSFGPKGGFSWGGAQGIHESSSWGRLVFNLTDAQLRAIKRRLIYASYKNWNVGSHGEVAPFDKWADPVIGDPAFYETIKPLEAELVGYRKRVTAEMSDADVDEIYAKGLIRWIGIRHELDRLRRDYLTAKSFGQTDSGIAARDAGDTIVLQNEKGRAEIALKGGRILSWRPAGGREVFFMPEQPIAANGDWCHGGMPVCWPWFGRKDGAIHGFVRARPFKVAARTDEPGRSSVTLVTEVKPDENKSFPHAAKLELVVTLADGLSLTVRTTNTGAAPFTFSQGIHPYFSVLGYAGARLSGVEAKPFAVVDGMDKAFARRDGALVLEEKDRTLTMSARGNSHVVVWSPGTVEPPNRNLKPGDPSKFVAVGPFCSKTDGAVTLAPGKSCELAFELACGPNS